jgi:exonuclease VII large subunit
MRLTATVSMLEAATALSSRNRNAMFATLDLRLGAAGNLGIGRAATAMERLLLKLEPLDPKAPLRRGYAMVEYEGRLVRNAEDVPVGAQIMARVARGALRARVEEAVLHGDE